jgi:hypothetical protein
MCVLNIVKRGHCEKSSDCFKTVKLCKSISDEALQYVEDDSLMEHSAVQSG